MFSSAGYSFAQAPDGASAVRHAPERYDALCRSEQHDQLVAALPSLFRRPEADPADLLEATPDRVLRRSGNRQTKEICVADHVRDPRADNAFKQEVAECSAAYDGESGLQEVLTHRPDVVLLDISMPGLDGYNTCRYIRSELGNDVLIVAVTGYGQAHDKEASARAGFDAHLTKPADSTALANLLGQRGRRRSQQSTSIR